MWFMDRKKMVAERPAKYDFQGEGGNTRGRASWRGGSPPVPRPGRYTATTPEEASRAVETVREGMRGDYEVVLRQTFRTLFPVGR
jgi:hypothetical protein